MLAQSKETELSMRLHDYVEASNPLKIRVLGTNAADMRLTKPEDELRNRGRKRPSGNRPVSVDAIEEKAEVS